VTKCSPVAPENGRSWASVREHLDMTRQAVTKHLCAGEAGDFGFCRRLARGQKKLHTSIVPLHEISERWIGNTNAIAFRGWAI